MKKEEEKRNLSTKVKIWQRPPLILDQDTYETMKKIVCVYVFSPPVWTITKVKVKHASSKMLKESLRVCGFHI